MKKKLLTIALIASSIILNNAQAGNTTYTCKLEQKVVNGENVNFNGSKTYKIVVNSEWYGKPSSLVTYYLSGKVELILASTQDKMEWLKSDKVKFATTRKGLNGDSVYYIAKMAKSKPIKIEMDILSNIEGKTDKITVYNICSEGAE